MDAYIYSNLLLQSQQENNYTSLTNWTAILLDSSRSPLHRLASAICDRSPPIAPDRLSYRRRQRVAGGHALGREAAEAAQHAAISGDLGAVAKRCVHGGGAG